MSGAGPDAGLFGRVVRNVVMQGASQGLMIVLGLATAYVLSRALGDEAWGGYLYVLFTVLYLFQTLNDLGMGPVMVREIAQTPERATVMVQNFIGLRMALAGLSLAVGAVFAWTAPLPAAYRWPVALILLVLPVQACNAPSLLLQARVQIARGVGIDVVNRLAAFALMMVAVWAGKGLLWVTAALVAGEVAGTAVLAAATWRVVPMRPRANLAEWRRIVRLSLPLSGQYVLTAMLNRLDALMLQSSAGLVTVGVYLSAYRVPSLFERLPSMVMATVFPLMSELAVHDVTALRRVYHRTLVTLGLIGLPVLAVVTWAAPLIVGALFPPELAAVAPLMRVVIWATAFLYFGISAGNLLIALRRPVFNLIATAAAAVVNLGLNLLWIPRSGAMGAAKATVIGFFVLCAVTLALAEYALLQALAARERARCES